VADPKGLRMISYILSQADRVNILLQFINSCFAVSHNIFIRYKVSLQLNFSFPFLPNNLEIIISTGWSVGACMLNDTGTMFFYPCESFLFRQFCRRGCEVAHPSCYPVLNHTSNQVVLVGAAR
jgi:hypothetical protein